MEQKPIILPGSPDQLRTKIAEALQKLSAQVEHVTRDELHRAIGPDIPVEIVDHIIRTLPREPNNRQAIGGFWVKMNPDDRSDYVFTRR